MRRETIEKTVVTIVLVIWWLVMPVIGYGGDAQDDILQALIGHLVYPLSHANIWHLAGNLFVWWLIPGKLWLPQALAISFLCSWLPVWGLWDIGMTVGFSGVLFAIVGIQWGRWARREVSSGNTIGRTLWEPCRKVLPYVFVAVLLPHMNWCIHLYTVLAGFILGLVMRHNGR